ncbi:MAG: alpha/beta hydrolase [Bdellovibrionales bacterium]|nr:alpha/beta hydrolase [Bdellovibrionales bacterium]
MRFIAPVILTLTVFLFACSSAPKYPVEPSGILNTARETIARDRSLLFGESYSGTREIKVRFATNRDQESARPIAPPTFGEAIITVPESHQVGTISSAFIRGETRTYTFDELKTGLLSSREWGTLLFVHGFNVDFNEALFRSAQIAYDLKFQGSILLLSWPAGKSGGFFEKNLINKTYESNQRNAQQSIDSFESIFQELSLLPIPFQMIVHSMGHQVAIPAMLKLSSRLEHGFLQELVLNAPDYDPEEFGTNIASLSKLVKRITVYCSQKDNALLASKAFHGKKRLGACARHDGVDVVNVSEVDDPGLTGLGHGYYSSRPILTDLAQVFLGVEAEKRLFIRKSGNSESEHYFLRR